MTVRRFKISFGFDGEEDLASGILELDQKVIDVVDDEWRSQLYQLYTPEDIAAHIGYNMLRNWNCKLTDLDGWADLSDDLAKVIKWPHLDQWETEAEEMK